MRQDQIALQRLELVGGDARLGELAEAGVDAIGRGAAVEHRPDGGERGIDARAGTVVEGERRVAMLDRREVGEGDGRGIEDKGRHARGPRLSGHHRAHGPRGREGGRSTNSKETSWPA